MSPSWYSCTYSDVVSGWKYVLAQYKIIWEEEQMQHREREFVHGYADYLSKIPIFLVWMLPDSLDLLGTKGVQDILRENGSKIKLTEERFYNALQESINNATTMREQHASGFVQHLQLYHRTPTTIDTNAIFWQTSLFSCTCGEYFHKPFEAVLQHICVDHRDQQWTRYRAVVSSRTTIASDIFHALGLSLGQPAPGNVVCLCGKPSFRQPSTFVELVSLSQAWLTCASEAQNLLDISHLRRKLAIQDGHPFISLVRRCRSPCGLISGN